MLFKRLQNSQLEAVSPFHRIAAMRNSLDALFNPSFVTTENGFHGTWPALDVYENDQGLVACVEVPGMKKEDISVSLEDGVLTVSGERRQETKDQSSTLCRCESSSGRFERQFALPYAVATDRIDAKYADGILTVTLPKAEEAKPKQIPVNVN